MAKSITNTFSMIQPSFAGGEVSPTLYGRIDIAKYAVSLRKCRNFIVRQYGGVENRPGTRFIAAAKYADKKCRLIPFQFNMEQTYALEFGDGYMRVFKDGGQVLISSGDDAGDIYELTTPYAEADLFRLAFTQSADVMTICHPAYPPMELQRYDHDDWQIVEVVTKNGPFEDINVDEATTVYASAETGTVTLTSSASLFKSQHIGKMFYIEQQAIDSVPVWEVGKSISPDAVASQDFSTPAAANAFAAALSSGQLISITEETTEGSSVWRVTYNQGFTRRAGDNYYLALTTGTTGTLRPSHTEGAAWDGWQIGAGIQWRYLHSGFGIVRITAVSGDGLTATATVISRIPSNAVGSTKATYKWAHYAWNSDLGYPGTVVYYQQRLLFAASSAYPQTVWGSRTGDYKDFGRNNPIQDDDRILYTYAGRQVNEIRHLIDIGSLIALTSGGQFKITGNDNSVLTPSTFSFSSQGADGSSRIPPIAVSNIAMFIQEKGAQVRDIAYSFDVDGYQGTDLTIMANHLFNRHQIVDWSFTLVPYSCAWCCRDDGMLMTMTYLRDQQVYAWAPQPSDGLFESTCSISEGTEDAVYFAVQRTINGVTKRCIERLESRYEDVDAFFVDSGLSYDGRNKNNAVTVTLSGGSGDWDYRDPITLTISGAAFFTSGNIGDQVHIPYAGENGGEVLRLDIAAVTSGNTITVTANRNTPEILRNAPVSVWGLAKSSFSGLDHLNGSVVSILSDASVEPQKTVIDGVVTLTAPGVVVHAGLPIESEIETLDLNIQGSETILDKKKLITAASLVVSSSRGIWAGTAGGKLYEYPQREFEFYDDPVDNATGVVSVNLDATWGKGARVVVQQTDPLPLAVLAIIPRITAGGF
ncbi:hypothetical protein SOASR014_37740 [Pectobacterium carotovorum subsp. carotovorum]|nr:hypothetical protein SOASR014_37740 [Pectobacterium carotovorum subsp. carotovorum]GLX46176.1 hypothetical protein Pcaca01_38440 [Pectobacterium carotovorum subsp. carotovorum]